MLPTPIMLKKDVNYRNIDINQSMPQLKPINHTPENASKQRTRNIS